MESAQTTVNAAGARSGPNGRRRETPFFDLVDDGAMGELFNVVPS